MPNEGIEGIQLLEWAVCLLDQCLILPTARKEVQEKSWSHQRGRGGAGNRGFKEAAVCKSRYCSQKWSHCSLAKSPFQEAWRARLCFENQDPGTPARCVFTRFWMLLVWGPFRDVNSWGCTCQHYNITGGAVVSFDKNSVHFEVVISIILGNATKALSLSNHV